MKNINYFYKSYNFSANKLIQHLLSFKFDIHFFLLNEWVDKFIIIVEITKTCNKYACRMN